VVTPAAEPSAAAPRPQSELLAGYRQRLSELFARHQEYPRVAAMRGWEGEVRLRLKVARKGNLLAVHLDHSSGFDVLDHHALAMLEALAGLPPLPEALDSNEIQVVVPINYKLKKTT
jgi:protein TonB